MRDKNPKSWHKYPRKEFIKFFFYIKNLWFLNFFLNFGKRIFKNVISTKIALFIRRHFLVFTWVESVVWNINYWREIYCQIYLHTVWTKAKYTKNSLWIRLIHFIKSHDEWWCYTTVLKYINNLKCYKSFLSAAGVGTPF